MKTTTTSTILDHFDLMLIYCTTSLAVRLCHTECATKCKRFVCKTKQWQGNYNFFFCREEFWCGKCHWTAIEHASIIQCHKSFAGLNLFSKFKIFLFAHLFIPFDGMWLIFLLLRTRIGFVPLDIQPKCESFCFSVFFIFGHTHANDDNFALSTDEW